MQKAQTSPSGLDVKQMRQFVRLFAPRMSLLQGQMATFFEKEFIDKDSNLQFLIRSAANDDRRRQIAGQLIAHAAKSNDRNRLMSRLASLQT